MKRLLSLIIFLGMSQSLLAQNPTTVTGTITDPSGVPYFPATVTACLTPVTTDPIVNGVHVNQTQGGNYCAPLQNTSVTGAFSLGLFPNSAITPSGTQWRFTVTALGTAPPAGKGSQTFQSTITISGTSQDIGATLTAASLALLNGGGGASPKAATDAGSSTIQLTDPKYNFPGTAQWSCQAGITNASNIVTTPASDPPFTGSSKRNAQVGDIVWASNALCGNEGAAGNLPTTLIAQGTITSVDSAHQVHVSNNASATCTVVANDQCVFVWGPDATTAVQNAWQDAGNACGTLVLPAGGILLQSQPNATNIPCSGFVAGNDSGNAVTVYGAGPYSTMLLFSPLSTFTSTVFAATTATGATLRHSIHDFGLASFTLAPAAAATKVGLSCPNQESECYRLWFLDYFPSIVNNFTAMSSTACGSCYATAHDLIIEDSGFTALSLGGTFSFYSNIVISSQSPGNGISVAANDANIYDSTIGSQFGAGGVGSAFSFNSGTGSLYFRNDQFLGGTNGVAVLMGGAAGTKAQFENSSITASGNQAALSISAGNTVTFDGQANTVTGAGTANGITNAGTLTLRNTAVSTGTGVSLSNSGTVTIKDGVAFPKGITNTGVIQVIQNSGGYSGACTGVVTSGATIGLYGLGQTTATTCTSTTVASGQVMSRPGTVYALYCTATAGNQAADACTVVKNGVAQTMTCSLNAVTSCTDGATAHQVTYVAGDILGIEVIAGVATTLANVKGLMVAP